MYLLYLCEALRSLRVLGAITSVCLLLLLLTIAHYVILDRKCQFLAVLIKRGINHTVKKNTVDFTIKNAGSQSAKEPL